MKIGIIDADLIGREKHMFFYIKLRNYMLYSIIHDFSPLFYKVLSSQYPAKVQMNRAAFIFSTPCI